MKSFSRVTRAALAASAATVFCATALAQTTGSTTAAIQTFTQETTLPLGNISGVGTPNIPQNVQDSIRGGALEIRQLVNQRTDGTLRVRHILVQPNSPNPTPAGAQVTTIEDYSVRVNQVIQTTNPPTITYVGTVSDVSTVGPFGSVNGLPFVYSVGYTQMSSGGTGSGSGSGTGSGTGGTGTGTGGTGTGTGGTGTGTGSTGTGTGTTGGMGGGTGTTGSGSGATSSLTFPNAVLLIPGRIVTVIPSAMGTLTFAPTPGGGTGPTAPTIGIADRIVTLTTEVELNAMATDPTNSTLTYQWKAVSGAPNIQDPTAAKTRVQVPRVFGEHVVELKVTNAVGESTTKQVTIVYSGSAAGE